MAEYIITKKSNLVAVADSIRGRTGETDKITLDEMINDINYEIGGDTSVEDGLITGTLTSYTNDRVTTIGRGAFYFCPSLTSVSFPATTNIGSSAFQHCTNLTSVSFPATIYIGSCAFQECTKLTSVSFPATVYIADYAFRSCTNLTSVSFPATTGIDLCAFESCTNLTSVSFPATTYISGYAFQECTKLTSVNFPQATSIGTYAFQGCTKLTSVNFPQATSIVDCAFKRCTKLTSVNFPQATSIGYGAFSSCYALTTVSFPVATTIGSYAFAKCYNLKSLYLTGSSLCKLSGSNAFSSTPIGGYSTSAGTYGSIYVPASLLTSYKTATNWTYFSSRFVGVGSSEEGEGGSGAPELGGDTITFTIDGREYQADAGMTWREWVESDYNTDSFWADGGNVYNRYDHVLKCDMSIGSYVSPSDEIIADVLYVTASSGGSFP